MHKYIQQRNQTGIITNKKHIIKYFNNFCILKAKENGYTIVPEIIDYKNIMIKKEYKGQRIYSIYYYKNTNFLANYDKSDNHLRLNMFCLLDNLSNDININDINFLKILYHELEHQKQIFNPTDVIVDNLKSKKNNYNNYLFNHDYYEMEIDANLKAYQNIKNDIFNEQITRLYDYLPLIEEKINIEENKRLDKRYKLINQR